MLSRPFICGAFHPEEEDELGAITSPSSTPRRSFKKHSFCRAHSGSSSKNPYSTRGLDKFEKLLADLEEKRKQIYTQNDPEDISFVRFAYTSSNDCVPIVVKSKDNKNNSQSRSPPRETTDQDYKKPTHDDNPESVQCDHNQPKDEAGKKKDRVKTSSSWKLGWDQLRRPAYYIPAAIILILVLLMFFGRSVAILCTSIGWYTVPTLKRGSSVYEGTKPGKKKVLARRSSENRIIVNRDKSPEKSPEKHGQRKSW